MNAVLPGSSIGGVGSMGSMDNSIPVDFNGPVALGGLGSVIPLQFLHDAQQSQNHQQNQGGELQNTSSGLLTPGTFLFPLSLSVSVLLLPPVISFSILTSIAFSPFRRNPSNGLQQRSFYDESGWIAQSPVYRTVAKFDDSVIELLH